jgi:hypothetical protein
MDAAARLRYVSSVQERTRRALLAPSYALILLGALVAVRGALATVWPHAALVTITWLAVIIAARPLLLWLRRRLEAQRGIYSSLRLRLGVGAAGLAAAAVAIGFGVNPFLASIAAATAVTTYLAGLPGIAAAALVAGIVADVVAAEGSTPAAGELLFGAALIAVGRVSRARERT